MPPTSPVFGKNSFLEVGEANPFALPFGAGPPREPTRGKTNDPPSSWDQKKSWAKKEVNYAEDNHLAVQREHMRECANFVAGDQLDPATRRELTAAKRPDNAFNKVQTFVRQISGIERRAPQALIFQPCVFDSQLQQALGEALTMQFAWAMGQCAGNFERARAFEDMITGGIGFTDTFLDFTGDPRGLVKHVRVDPFEMLWPDCGEENLRTTRWRARECWIGKDEALRRWPDRKLLIEATADSGNDSNFPQRSPVTYEIPYAVATPIDKLAQRDPDKHGKVKILQFQWYEDEEGLWFDDPTTKEPMWLPTREFKAYERSVMALSPNVKLFAKKQWHRVTRVMYLLNREHLLEEPKRLPRDLFTLNAMTGYFNASLRIWYSIIAHILSPQRFANRMWNLTLETMATNSKSGAMIEEDAFVTSEDKKKFADTFSRPGSVQDGIASGALAAGKIQIKQPAAMPAGSMELLQFCLGVMDPLAGLQVQGLEGAGGSQVPAAGMEAGLRARLTILAHEFDALSRYRLENEGPVVAAHLGLIADGRMVQVSGEVGSMTLRLMRQTFALEVNLQLDDSSMDPSLRKHQQDLIMQLAPTLAKQGLFIPELWNYFDLPFTIRRALVKAMTDRQQQQMEAEKQGLSLGGRRPARDPKETQAKIQNILSHAELNRAKAAAIPVHSKRDEVRTILDGLKGKQEVALQTADHQLQRAGHGLERDKHALDWERLRLERDKAAAHAAVEVLKARNQGRASGGR